MRSQLVAEYESLFGDRFDATLAEVSESEWIDVWHWVDRADADAVLENRELVPAFARWEALVELHSVTWGLILD
jgi:hypothetical protein